MEYLFNSRHRRRLVLIGAGLVLIVLISFRYFILPAIDHENITLFPRLIDSLLDSLIIATITTSGIPLIARLLIPPVMEVAKIEIIEPKRIKETLDFAREHTREWWYAGHLGRHFRVVTLKRLAEVARSNNHSKEIYLLILDPTDKDTCQRFADYRRGVNTGLAEEWTAERVQKELYATIAAVCHLKAKEPQLIVTIALWKKVTIFRVDLCEQFVLVTMEDPRMPAIRYDQGTLYFDPYKEELRLNFEQSRKLDLRGISNLRGISDLNTLLPSTLDNLFKKLRVSSTFLTIAILEEIITLIKEEKNPYA